MIRDITQTAPEYWLRTVLTTADFGHDQLDRLVPLPVSKLIDVSDLCRPPEAYFKLSLLKYAEYNGHMFGQFIQTRGIELPTALMRTGKVGTGHRLTGRDSLELLIDGRFSVESGQFGFNGYDMARIVFNHMPELKGE